MDPNIRILIPEIPGTLTRRTLSGDTAVWNDKFHQPRGAPEVPEIRIKAPQKGMDAELIDGAWYWVCACPECKGQEPQWVYSKCEEHDVCDTCRTPRAKLTDIPWGTKAGFRCKPCEDARVRALKIERLSAVAAKDYDPSDYEHTDQVICPHCETKMQTEAEDHPKHGIDNQTCDVCGGEYIREVHYEVSWSTVIKGERVTLEDV